MSHSVCLNAIREHRGLRRHSLMIHKIWASKNLLLNFGQSTPYASCHSPVQNKLPCWRNMLCFLMFSGLVPVVKSTWVACHQNGWLACNILLLYLAEGQCTSQVQEALSFEVRIFIWRWVVLVLSACHKDSRTKSWKIQKSFCKGEQTVESLALAQLVLLWRCIYVTIVSCPRCLSLKTWPLSVNEVQGCWQFITWTALHARILVCSPDEEADVALSPS